MAATNESMRLSAAAPQERQRLTTDEENYDDQDLRPLLIKQQRTRGIKAMAQSAGNDVKDTLEADKADHYKSISAMSQASSDKDKDWCSQAR